MGCTAGAVSDFTEGEVDISCIAEMTSSGTLALLSSASAERLVSKLHFWPLIALTIIEDWRPIFVA